MDATLLRTRRKALGYTQARLAEAAGVDVRTVGRAESGQDVAAETMVSLCAVLGLSSAEVMSERTTPDTAPTVTTIRSGKPSDQVDLLPEIERSLLDLAGVHTLVLPDLSMPAPRIGFTKAIGVLKPGEVIFMAFVAVPAGGAFTYMLRELGVVGDLHSAASVATQVLGVVLFIALALGITGAIERGMALATSKQAKGEAIDRAYAFAKGKVHLIEVTPDRILRREVIVDPRRRVHRHVEGDTVNYGIPTADGYVSLASLPVDPRIDALLMRDEGTWGYHAHPRACPASKPTDPKVSESFGCA